MNSNFIRINAIHVVALLLVLGFSSCLEDAFRKEVKVDVDNSFPKYSLYCNLEPYKDEQQVFVHTTKSVLETSKPEPVLGAQVKIFKGNEAFVLSEKQYGIRTAYEPDTKIDFKPKDNVRLEVLTPSKQLLTASGVIPSVPSVEILEHKKGWKVTREYGFTDSLAVYIMKVRIFDVQNEENFYSFGINQYIQSQQDPSKFSIDFKQPLVVDEDPSFEYAHFYQVLTDRLFQNGSIVKTLYFENFTDRSSKNEFVTFSHSKEKYRFGIDLDNADLAEDNPFAEPVVIYSNVEGGTGHLLLSSTIDPISF